MTIKNAIGDGITDDTTALQEAHDRKRGLAAGPWQTGPAPKDGRKILAIFEKVVEFVKWDKSSYFGDKSYGWYVDNHTCFLMDPDQWAEIYEPRLI